MAEIHGTMLEIDERKNIWFGTLNRQGPERTGELLYTNGEFQDRGDRVVFGYWVGNQDAKKFVKRGGAFKHHFETLDEVIKAALELALEADARDGK